MPRPKREVPWLGTRKGVYTAFWYNQEKRRTDSLSLGTKEAVEATERFAAFLTKGRRVFSGNAPELTVKECLDSYLAEHVERSVIDKARQYDAVANLRLFFDKMVAKDVGIPESRTYAALRETGAISLSTKHGKPRSASAGTIKRELGVLAAAFNHAAKWKRLDRNDLPSLEKPRTKASKGIWLFPDELEKLRASADQRTRDFIDLCYYTGARRRSIERLTWFQVDMERGRINLSRADDPDTKKRRPIVSIAPELRGVLERLKPETISSGLVLGCTAAFWKRFIRAATTAQLRNLPARDMRPEGQLSPHVLRHSRATHLLHAGVNPKAVADLLGDNVMTVLRVYGHACPDFMAGISNAQKGA